MEDGFDRFHIKAFWMDVVQEINNKLWISLDLDPLVCILRTFSYNTWSSSKIQLLKIVLFTARRCKLMRWISKKQPKKTHQQRHNVLRVYWTLCFLKPWVFPLKQTILVIQNLGSFSVPFEKRTMWYDMTTWHEDDCYYLFLLLFFVCFVFCCCCCSSFLYIFFNGTVKNNQAVTPFSTSSRNVSNKKKICIAENCITLKLYKLVIILHNVIDFTLSLSILFCFYLQKQSWMWKCSL